MKAIKRSYLLHHIKRDVLTIYPVVEGIRIELNNLTFPSEKAKEVIIPENDIPTMINCLYILLNKERWNNKWDTLKSYIENQYHAHVVESSFMDEPNPRDSIVSIALRGESIRTFTFELPVLKEMYSDLLHSYFIKKSIV